MGTYELGWKLAFQSEVLKLQPSVALQVDAVETMQQTEAFRLILPSGHLLSQVLTWSPSLSY